MRMLSSSAFNITGTLRDGISAGAYAELHHIFDQTTVNSFASICGDNNPLHIDRNFAEKTFFKGTIVHGILVSSLFSTLFGRSINGAVYVSQNLQFLKPVFVGANIIARIEVLNVEKKRKGNLITCSTFCTLEDGSKAVNGEAKVLVPVIDTVVKEV